MDDLVKIAVIAGIMGAFLVFGLLLNVPDRAAPEPVAVIEQPEVTQVTVLPPTTLEMLDPVYSEKAVFQDGTIRIAFNVSHTEAGVESRLPFWLHNVSGDVVSVLWDRCSMQLPCANTVHVVNEEGLAYGGSISVAPGGDLFDAVMPITEVSWEGDPKPTTGVLDQGTFTFVLAIERSGATPILRAPATSAMPPAGCEPFVQVSAYPAREVVFYTFRFIVR